MPRFVWIYGVHLKLLLVVFRQDINRVSVTLRYVWLRHCVVNLVMHVDSFHSLSKGRCCVGRSATLVLVSLSPVEIFSIRFVAA